MTFVCAAALALIVALFARCAGAEGHAAPVTATEAMYRDAVTTFLECMKDFGYQVSGPAVSPLDQRMLLRDVVVPSDGRPDEYNRRLAGCDRKAKLGTVEPAYLGSHQPSLHPRLRDDAVACLHRQGVTAHGAEVTYGDYVSQATVTQDFGQCLVGAMQAAFPELPPRVTVFY
ncbi:hypothetical protein Q0Z83_043900 [Actinoplanes sichuanensis]|nr:hypothetical protein Q0Z83_043900 [Actinoplanes sichuanensis]